MKKLCFLFFILCAMPVVSQSSWIESNISRESNANTPKDVLPIVNKNTNELALFYKAKRVVFAKLYNKNQELISSINAINIPKKTKILIGATYNEDSYTLFFCNSKKTRFSSVSINIKTKSFNINDHLNIILDNEKVVEFLIDNNTITILTISKKESLFNTYVLKNRDAIVHNKFDFSNYTIKTDKDFEYDLYNLIFGNPAYSSVEVINNNLPNALEKTSAFTKVYFKDQKITITNNLFDKYTYFFKIDLSKNAVDFDFIENKNYSKKYMSSNSNSYIFKDYFFNIYSNPQHLDFNVYNIKTKEIIKKFEIKKGEAIAFKNTPIIQEGGEFDSYRELEKTSKFLRKITNSKIGICAYEKDNLLIITLGASEEIQTTPMVGFGVGGALGGLISGIIYASFNSYTHTKSTRIECLFNMNFKHIMGEIPKNDFNKIDDFKITNGFENSKLQTVFKYHNNFIFGALDKKTNLYKLYKLD